MTSTSSTPPSDPADQSSAPRTWRDIPPAPPLGSTLPPPLAGNPFDLDPEPRSRKRPVGVVVAAIVVLLALVFGGFAAVGGDSANDTSGVTDTAGSTPLNSTKTDSVPATTPEEDGNSSSPAAGTPESVAKVVGPAVVQIDDGAGGIGSGVIYDAAGLVLTAHHVVERVDTVSVVLADGTKLDGRIVGRQPARDLAIVAVTATKELTAAELGGGELAIGQPVVALGSPFGYQASVTSGIISGLNRQLTIGQMTLTGLIQTDAAINPGNSGGPLIDARNRVIGINTAIATTSGGSNGVGFAVPVSDAEDLMKRVTDDGGAKAPTVPAPEGAMTTPDFGFDFQLPDSLGDLFGDLFDQLGPGEGGTEQSPLPNTQAQDSSIVELGPLPRGWTASNDMSFLSNGQGVQNITLAGPSGQIIITATKGPSADSAAKQYSGTGEVRTFEPDVTVIVEGVGNVSASDLKAVADGITVK